MASIKWPPSTGLSGGTCFVWPARNSAPDPPPFTPDSIANLILWLDAADTATLNSGTITDGDPVSAWADKSISGYDFTQATGLHQPVWDANSLNSNGGVSFIGIVGATKYLSNSSGHILASGATPFTIMSVLSFTAYDPVGNLASGFCSFAGTAGNSPEFLFWNPSSGPSFSGYQNIFFGAALSGTYTTAHCNTTFASLSTPYMVGLTYDGSGLAAGYQFYSDNVAQTTSVGFDDTVTSSTNIVGAMTGGANSLQGPINEHCIWNRVLDSTELGQMATYYTSKWGTFSP